MLNNMNHNELKCVLDRYYKKIIRWFFIAVAWMMVMAVVSTYLWDHWVINVISLIGFVYPAFLSFYVMIKVEPIYEKIKPKSDFLMIQKNEKSYLKAKKFLERVTLIGFIMMIVFILAKVFIRFKWIDNEMPENIDAVIIFALFIAAMASWTCTFVEIMRKQYVNHYEKYHTDKVDKEKKDELDQ